MYVYIHIYIERERTIVFITTLLGLPAGGRRPAVECGAGAAMI